MENGEMRILKRVDSGSRTSCLLLLVGLYPYLLINNLPLLVSSSRAGVAAVARGRRAMGLYQLGR
jgi:hypothetical protein